MINLRCAEKPPPLLMIDYTYGHPQGKCMFGKIDAKNLEHGVASHVRNFLNFDV
jgi:hypothetical protein